MILEQLSDELGDSLRVGCYLFCYLCGVFDYAN